MMLIAVNYHYIRPSFDSPYPGIHGITPAQLEGQLQLLGSIGVFVSAAQIRAAVRDRDELPDRSMIITFDDGLREHYEFVWPILRRLGIPGIFFVNTAPILHSTISSVHKIHLLRASVAPAEFLRMLHRHARLQGLDLSLQVDERELTFYYRYDTPEVAQLKYLLNFLLAPGDRDRLIGACFHDVFPGQEAKMSRDFYLDLDALATLGADGCLGTHGHEHLPLGLLSTEAAWEDLRSSVVCLERWGGSPPFALSYPYGSREACSPEVGEMARRSGIELAFTMERAGNPDLTKPLFLARFDNNDVPGGKASRWTVDNFFESIPSADWYRE
jgi:peptidoglycan/xylan/chitin deacetylase (PgdA/CDA1 family)